MCIGVYKFIYILGCSNLLLLSSLSSFTIILLRYQYCRKSYVFFIPLFKLVNTFCCRKILAFEINLYKCLLIL